MLKIDRSFIVDIDRGNQEAKKLTRAMVNMAQALNLEVVAEGVETKNTLDWLYGLDCVLIQGYYFSKPLMSDEIDNYLMKYLTVRRDSTKKVNETRRITNQLVFAAES